MTQRWSIFCDTNSISGKGHISRMLVLAEKLKKKKKIVFITSSLKNRFCKDITNAGYNIYEIEKMKFKKNYMTIIDGYFFSKKHIDIVKNGSKFTLQILDYGSKFYKTNYIISYDKLFKNPGIIGEGLRYSIINSNFENKKYIKKKPENLMINFGLFDKYNFTYKILKCLSLRNSLRFKKIFVACRNGAYKSYVFKSLVRKLGAKFVAKEFNEDFFKIVKLSDIIVGAGGVSLLERLCSGAPSITFCTSRNQKQLIEFASMNRATLYCGDYSNFSREKFLNSMSEIFFNYKLRRELSLNGQKIIDGNGSNRLVDKLLSL